MCLIGPRVSEIFDIGFYKKYRMFTKKGTTQITFYSYWQFPVGTNHIPSNCFRSSSLLTTKEGKIN